MRLGACQWPRTPLACSDQTKSWEEPLQPSTSLRKGQPAGRATPADPHDDSPTTPRSVTCAAHIRAVLPLMSAAGTPVVRRSPHPRRSATWCGISAVSPMPSATRLPASAVHYLAVHVIAILLSKDPCYAQCRGE